MTRKKHHKTKRQQPRPKNIKKKPAIKNTCFAIEDSLRSYGKTLKMTLENKEMIVQRMHAEIDKVISYFEKYDTVQLLGSVGLYLLDNLSNIEKKFISQVEGRKLSLDEDAEVIAEYAMNFGMSMSNTGQLQPSEDVVLDLRESLRGLSKAYSLLDMPLEDEAEQLVDWMIHADTISVRGGGYMVHFETVFKELFRPHSKFYEDTYGFSVDELFDFLTTLEERIFCKIGSNNSIYGITKMHDRWVKWEEQKFGPIDDPESMAKRDLSKGLFGEFFEANPDVPHTEDGQQFLCYQPDDYSGSDKIFWVYPQNEVESSIMASLSSEFGSNEPFIKDGEYKGNIMNGHSIYERPFVKDGDRYYCFTPLLVYRNLFLIAEKLMMRDDTYYQRNFQQNQNPISRDKYIENKVKSILCSFLPNVAFVQSVHYNIVENGVEKTPELDIIGTSEKATYIVEVKAHELSHKDRVGIHGAKVKFNDSVWAACNQCCRVKEFIDLNGEPVFTSGSGNVIIDKTKPIYKIAVTFQHYSMLLGNMDKLIECGMMEDRFRDTWIVSLFDLMVVSEFVESEEEFIEYLEMHKSVYGNHCTFTDELDLFGGFLNDDLATKVRKGKKIVIIGGHEAIDEEYSKDYYLPIETND